MKKVIYLYSGEGTKSSDSHYKLIQHSAYWVEIKEILKSKLNLDLEKIWNHEIGSNRCPHSPLLTVVLQICLSDLWQRWGYKPDVVIGHSIGELAAAYQAGLYTIEEILLLAHQIGEAAGKLDGVMMHGKLSDSQIHALTVNLSSFNFADDSLKHVTVGGYTEEMEAFAKDHPEFRKMLLPHPWHHPDYLKYAQIIKPLASQKTADVKFVSGVTSRFETQLAGDYWRKWLVGRINFIDAMQRIKEQYGDDKLDIIEIGFHPVLDKCCEIFDNYRYVASMYRGEDEIKWILHQRKKLDPGPFQDSLKKTIDEFSAHVDDDTSLAYQGFSSLRFLEFSEHLQTFFPSLAPQDFYRYKTINQLIKYFGIEKQADVDQPSGMKKNQVVIAAMSCRFPSKVENLTQFWNMLLSGKDQVQANAKRGDGQAGYLDDEIARFDHKYFKISNAEAQSMDPQQILALELTELLWKDAGFTPEKLDRKRIGVYLGVWNQEYGGDKESVYFATGTNPSLIANRISYQYDLRGPSWVSNTACSSSLVAVHYAAKDIEDGRVDYAIAGGVNMLLGDAFTSRMRASGFLSSDHRCKVFDDSANGYVRAEGGGLVLLVNKDLVSSYYAEVLGSSINQNGGRAQVITAPHAEAQEEVILSACQDAGIRPEDISYIECHGTGTKIGDPIEISALQRTIAKNRNGQKCYLGSVKSNIGHLESAAGIAGLIKSVLILNNGLIPANLHFHQPNQLIDFNAYPLKVVRQETPIDQQTNIGISSFGFGGSNAHIIIKGVAAVQRKAVENIAIPFDRNRALALGHYYHLDESKPAEMGEPLNLAGKEKNPKDIVTEMVLNLTGVDEIDPAEELFEQGLDSMSATELIHNLQQEFKVELDTDVLFDYPLINQLIELIESKIAEKNQNISQSELDLQVA
jgi:acyl transferase domain-containing protein/acyl carrier protein